MFVTSTSLQVQYGVDDKIAAFFVDREPPEENLYWHEKLLYLRPAPGYLFIPLIVDLLFKAGIEREQLLSEEFVNAMEQIGHISALEEIGQISNEEAIKRCAELVKGSCKNKEYFSNLIDYFNRKPSNSLVAQSTPYRALHRGDIFLFAICNLSFPNEFIDTLVKQWFALITTLLLLDDIDDVEVDLATEDENALLEAGLTAQGLQKLLDLVKGNLTTISVLNSTMANAFEKQYQEVFNMNPVFQILKRA